MLPASMAPLRVRQEWPSGHHRSLIRPMAGQRVALSCESILPVPRESSGGRRRSLECRLAQAMTDTCRRVWPRPAVEGKARCSQPGEVYPEAET